MPLGNLVTDEAGNLYGTMDGAGVGQAAVFKLSHRSRGWKVNLLYHQYLGPGLVLDSAGDLYGFLWAAATLELEPLGSCRRGPRAGPISSFTAFAAQKVAVPTESNLMNR